jgi:exonuclease III
MDTEFGTWNVRTLHKSGALKALIQQIQQYKLKVIAIQETRWLGNEIWDTKTHTFLNSGKKQRTHEAGVAFIVDKVMKRNIINFDHINERICILHLPNFSIYLLSMLMPPQNIKRNRLKTVFTKNQKKPMIIPLPLTLRW